MTQPPAVQKPNADKRNPALPSSRIRTRFFEAGRRDKHQIEKVIQTLRVDPGHPLVSFLQMGKIPQNQLDNLMIMAAESIMLPENRPENLPEGSLDLNSDDLLARLVYVRPLAQWSVNGSMVDKIGAGMVGFVQMLMRPFRRRQMKEMNTSEMAETSDSEFD